MSNTTTAPTGVVSSNQLGPHPNGLDGAVLGHKSTQSTKRYAHLATKTLAGALAKIGKKAA